MEQKVGINGCSHVYSRPTLSGYDIVVAGECKVTEASQVQGEATAQ